MRSLQYLSEMADGHPGVWRWLCWLLAPLVLFLPLLFISNLMFLGNSDALFYSNILQMMTESLKSGVPLPRWLAAANVGFGSPVMMFYAPLAYVVTALVNLPLIPLKLDTGTQLVVGMYASQVVSGYTCHRWLERDFLPNTALLGSVLFVLLPYKLIYIYLHINIAQLWALAMLPLWMIAARGILSRDGPAVGAYALALAVVYYTHPLTVIAFGAAPAAYVLCFGRRNFWRAVVRLVLAHALGCGLCLMQALPVHFDIGWIRAERFLDYAWQDNFYHIDVMLCAYYGVVAMLMAVAIRRVPSLAGAAATRDGGFWIIVIAVVAFLTQRLSAPVWQVLTPMQYLQFPAARLHAPALLAVTYLMCLWLSGYKAMLPLGKVAYRREALALLIVLFTFATGWRLYQVESDPMHASDTYMSDARAARLLYAAPGSVYETRWDCIDVQHVMDLFTDKQVPPPVTVISGDAEIASLAWSPPWRIAFDVDVRSDAATIGVRQCYVPLWQARDETGQVIPLVPQAPDGIVALDVPHGRHSIAVRLSVSSWEIAGRCLSLGSLCATVLLMLAPRYRVVRRRSGLAST